MITGNVAKKLVQKQRESVRCKALAIKQPSATFVANGQKKIEVRSWKTECRGDLLIVASKKPKKGLSKEYEDKDMFPLGCALGLVTLYDVRPLKPEDAEKAYIEWSDELEGLYAWEMKGMATMFNVPYPISAAKLKLFNVYIPKMYVAEHGIYEFNVVL